MTITQFEYYQRQKLHPSSSSVEDRAILKRYYAIRRNLYQNLLHLPMEIFCGRDVLEVGCGTGESSLILALHGAHLTLVDADPSVASRLKTLFDSFGISNSIRRQAFCTIAEFEDEPIFSMVTAEGFLFTLPNRDEMLMKLSRLVKPGGFCVLSFPDRFGSFFEFVKKAVLWRAYQIAGIEDVHSESALALARRLLEESHRSLPQARDFAVWWRDCIVSPFLRWSDCWSYDDILSLVRKAGCTYYSSTPRVYEYPHLSWYKLVLEVEDAHRRLLESYRTRKFDFLFGRPLQLSLIEPQISELTEFISDILKKFSAYFQSLHEELPPIDFSPAVRLFSELGFRGNLLSEMQQFFTLLQTDSLEKLVQGYLLLKEISASWGCSYHYLCFERPRTPF